jgi:hypothetical protein
VHAANHAPHTRPPMRAGTRVAPAGTVTDALPRAAVTSW